MSTWLQIALVVCGAWIITSLIVAVVWVWLFRNFRNY